MTKFKSENKNALSLDKYVKVGQNDAYMHRIRKKQQYYHKAKIVREYKRIAKREGIDIDEEKKPQRSKEDAPKPINGKFQKRKRFNKPDPLQKERKKAEKLQAEKAKKLEDKKKNEQLMKRKSRDRKSTNKKLSQRTNKGQPVMKHQIANLLKKLQK